ncbi:ATP-binding protein [Vitiosangium sp. GDMCC 1.1324]|uniref:sensor histidine kinase n=1 Tax=Vitiosangium sp. (strain GDMCC 1.1324) TaxID=2138576 RepID=UPI000D3B0FF8|nr:ATP-binding protein [Vitiosangium sp. GDMCC 1.1324]PTL84911.1 hypothetical protein DAT35_07615 [Vitiosangium sp. GDMCC 1.1324]
MTRRDLETQGRTRLCDFVRENQARILAEWEQEARAQTCPQCHSQPGLLEHVSELLALVSNAVEAAHPGEHPAWEEMPETHALERLELGYELEEVARANALLRECILRLYEAHTERVGVEALTVLREVRRFNQTFDEAVSLTMCGYARMREQQVRRESERMLERLRLQESRTARLQEVTAALSRALTADAVAQVVVEKAVRALEATGGSMGLLSEDGQHFEMRAATGYSREMLHGWERFPADSPMMFREAVRTGGLVLHETKESFLADYPQWAEDPAVKSHNAFATLPLLVEGRTLGALGLTFRERRSFSKEERDFMLVLAGQCAQALERGRLYDAEQQARAESQLALARLNLLMDTAPVGLGFWDKEMRYVRLNERLAEMNGVSVAAHLGRSVREVLPELADTIESFFREILRTGRALVDLEVKGETPAAPGIQRYWLVSYYPTRDVDGTLLGLAGVVLEITDRKRAEEELRRAAEFRERLLGIVSHDLRNPLNAILLSSNALIRSEGIPEPQMKSVRRIITSAERMARMIADLLDFTRGRLGGGIPVAPRPVNLRLLCRQVLEELEAGNPGRLLRMEAQGNLQGEWDPDRLSQVLGNLGGNALAYSFEDASVDVVLHDEGEAVLIEVHNQGRPIPEELLPRIFEPFRRATEDSAGQHASGLGLGLYISRQIVQSHGGTLDVRSSKEEGTTFIVRLPRQPR